MIEPGELTEIGASCARVAHNARDALVSVAVCLRIDVIFAVQDLHASCNFSPRAGDIDLRKLPEETIASAGITRWWSRQRSIDTDPRDSRFCGQNGSEDTSQRDP